MEAFHQQVNPQLQKDLKDQKILLHFLDLILFLIDSQRGIEKDDEYVLDRLRQTGKPKILVLNKIDLVSKPYLLPLIEKLQSYEIFQDVVPISALQQDGLDVLSGVILKHLPEGPRYFPENMITDCPKRFLIGEIIREKIIRLTRYEVPYVVAVMVDALEKGKKDQLYGKFKEIFSDVELIDVKEKE